MRRPKLNSQGFGFLRGLVVTGGPVEAAWLDRCVACEGVETLHRAAQQGST